MSPRGGLLRREVRIRETIAAVLSTESEYLDAAEREIRARRADLESHIAADPAFRGVIEPWEVPDRAPEIVRDMAEAASRAGVGPMAAVAAAIARYAVAAAVEAGAPCAVADNGGDIALHTDRTLTVGIYAGPGLPSGLGFEIPPTGGMLGICTSSGSVGPSISFGKADAATVVAPDPILADACATALGNRITSPDDGTIREAIDWALGRGAEGALVVAGAGPETRNHGSGGYVGSGGELPKIVTARVEYDLITKG